MESGTKCFTVTGEFLTDHCRTLWWDEGRKALAVDTLSCLNGIAESQIMDVIFGRSKLTGDSNTGINIKKDSAKHTSIGNPILTLPEMLKQKETQEKRAAEDHWDETHEMEYMPSPYGQVEIGHYAKRRILSGEETFESTDADGLLRRTHWQYPRPKDDEMEDSTDEEGLEAPKSPVEKWIDSQIEEDDSDGPPAVDYALHYRNGWLDREGRFFPCGYMGHIQLAVRLGSEERKLEKKGWVKISDPRTAPVPVPDRESVSFDGTGIVRPTELQRNVVRQWCLRHGRPIPDWASDS